MKILHSLETFLPDDCGGTEIYTQSLIQSMPTGYFEHEVIAPMVSKTRQVYQYQGFKVWRYPINHSDPSILQSLETPQGFTEFTSLLKTIKAFIYHQHAWQQTCGLWHLQAAKQQGLKTILTVHIPSITCICGTRVNNKGQQCDLAMSLDACGECCLRNRRLPVWITQTVTQLPGYLSEVLQMIPFPAPVSRLLVLQQQIQKHIEDVASMCEFADKVIAVCQWIYNALLKCGVPAEKMQLCRQGVAPQLLENFNKHRLIKPAKSTFSLGFIGRCDSLKGIDILIKAVLAQPKSVKLELIIHALDLDPKHTEHLSSYCQDIYQLCQNDSRIILKSPIQHQQLSEALQQFDMLAVPSQWLETGPLVVLEAFACHVPVLGSDLGGIAELIQHNKNGYLVTANDPDAWQQAIYLLATQPDISQQLKHQIEPVRTMNNVADDMQEIYQQVLL